MDNIVEYKDLSKNYILIDVRSPGEFEESHIPNSINIPLFTNEERSQVGTTYKQESVKKAKQIGIKYVSEKLPQMYEQIEKLCEKYEKVVVYCARGGMRSRSIVSLLNSLGYNVLQLKGGYKTYRNYVITHIEEMNQEVNYITLHGYTGVGKTIILNKLEQMGFDVLDLEGAANHRGSCLGKVGLIQKISQRQFESILFEKLRKRKTNFVFIEAESRRIGNVLMPNIIKERMQQGKQILVEADLEVRAKRIVKEYTKSQNAQKEIIDSIIHLKKLLGKKLLDELITLVNNEEYVEASKILMIEYYDKLYKHSQDKYEYDYVVNSNNIDKVCEELGHLINKETA